MTPSRPALSAARLFAHLALAACVACGDGAADGAQDGGAARGRDERGPAAPAEGRVISTVDGAAITVEEVEEVARETGLSPLDALRRLQEERVLVAHAEAAGLGDAPEVGDAVRRASVQALLARRVEAAITPETIPADEVRRRIEEQRARFARPERRVTTHVLARVPEGEVRPEAEAAAERFARRAIERLVAAADAVAEAHAMEAEDAPGRSFRVHVEDLPPVERDGRLVPEYLAATYSLERAGVVPQPVRTRFGWHAIVVREIVPPWRAPDDEVEETVRDELTVEARARRLDELVAELASRTSIALDEAAIERALAGDLAQDGAGDAR